MNSFTFANLKVGQREEFSVTLDEKMFRIFLEITKDDNPLHVDTEFAQKLGFKSKVAYGMLTSSFYSTLVGVYLPGRYSMLHGVDLQFSNPAYAGDSLKISGEVAFVNEAYKQIELKAEIRNQEGVRISKAKIKVGLSE